MNEQYKEINKLTEHLIQTKLKIYNDYLEALDDEFLGYEFYDRFGCDPLGYYANAIYAENEGKWIWSLKDNMANLLFDDPYMDPVNEEYLKAS